MTVIQYNGVTVDIVDDVDPRAVYSGTWMHRSPSPENYAYTVSETTVVGDTVNFTFTGTWVTVYGARSPFGTEKSTYAIDGDLQSTLVEASVGGLQKHNMQFFNSSLLSPGTHTLVVTNYGDSLLLDGFIVGLQDDVATSPTLSQPQSSTLPQASQTTNTFTITETVSSSSSSPGARGYSIPASPLVTSSLASVLSPSAQGVAALSAGPPDASSHPSLTTHTSSTESPSSDPSHQTSSHLSKAASAGLAVGISVFCLLVGGGILAWYCLSRRLRKSARAETPSVPAVVVTEYPSLEPMPSADEKRGHRFSDLGSSVFSLPPYGYTSRDPQVPTGSDFDDGLVAYNGLIDSKPPLPPMPLSPLRRASTSSAPPQPPNPEPEKQEPEGGRMSTLAPFRGRWK